MDPTTLSVIFGIFGAIGVLFGIYKHFSTLKVAKLFLDIKQISEFGLPDEFFKDIPSIPVIVEIENLGNKSSSNLILTLDFKSKIINKKVDSAENFSLEVNENKLVLKAGNLNPSERVKLYINCEKNIKPSQSIISYSNLTQSDGTVNSKESLLKQQKIIESMYKSLPFGIGGLIALTRRTRN